MDPSALLPHVVLQHLQDMTDIHSVVPGSTWIYLDLPVLWFHIQILLFTKTPTVTSEDISSTKYLAKLSSNLGANT